MRINTAIRLFESSQVRVHWDIDLGRWYFSVIDIIEILTDRGNPRRYWSDLIIMPNTRNPLIGRKTLEAIADPPSG